ncbi:MAG: ASKHA domain-containing protein [Lachnospiraceae bacterium]
MKLFTITFVKEQLSIQIPEGTTLLDAQIQAGLLPDAPCGGRGTCGKCTVHILSGQVTGRQKACRVLIHSDMTVLTSASFRHHILAKGSSREIPVSPMIRSLNVTVAKCPPGESTSDWERLKEGIRLVAPDITEELSPNLSIAANLYECLKSNAYQVNVLLCGHELLSLRSADADYYLAAFDIGTTTIVGYLLHGKTGEELAVASLLNPQTQYGADVIMRSNYALEHGTGDLSASVRGALNQLLCKLCSEVHISPTAILQAALVGNTCMHHLFLNISPGALVHAPYNPTLSEALLINASDCDIHIHPEGRILVLPVIAGFVGADTIGCLLAADFDKREPITLMIDIGTNGELVIGNKDRMITCSTAAGPALEGAKITCGMRGAGGAVDHVYLNKNEILYTTIENKKPAGICGSGLIDLTALLLTAGIIDKSGRILSKEEVSTPAAQANAHRITCIDNMPAFVLETAEKTQDQTPLYLTQKDIREIQLAKGAIATGIQLMCQHLEITPDQIEEVLIAGAFGNYMSPESACAIGLIPSVLQERITPIGNAAGEGAKIAVLNQQEFERTKTLARRIEFLELATDPAFQDCFVDNLEFPEQ